MKKKFKLDTNLVRGGLTRSNFKETSEAIFLNSGFVYDSAEQAEAIFLGKKKGFQYSRYANPTVEMFEKRLALLDGSEACFATASGMAAVFGSMMCQLKAGDHVVSASALFGSCRYILNDILPKFGIEVSFIDGKNIQEWNKSIQKNTKIFFFESPSNPCLEIIDIKQVCNLAKKNKIKGQQRPGIQFYGQTQLFGEGASSVSGGVQSTRAHARAGGRWGFHSFTFPSRCPLSLLIYIFIRAMLRARSHMHVCHASGAFEINLCPFLFKHTYPPLVLLYIYI